MLHKDSSVVQIENINHGLAEIFIGHWWHLVIHSLSPEEKMIESSACDRIPDWGSFKISCKWPIKDVTCKERFKRLLALWGIISKALYSWQVEALRLIAYVFVLCTRCQYRCPRGFPPAVRAGEELNGLSSHAGRRKMELWLLVSSDIEPVYHVSQWAGFILCSMKGVKQQGRMW